MFNDEGSFEHGYSAAILLKLTSRLRAHSGYHSREGGIEPCMRHKEACK